MKIETILILAAVGVGAYFLLKRPTVSATMPQIPGAPASGKSETTQALEGTASVIEAVGSAGGNILDSIWPD